MVGQKPVERCVIMRLRAPRSGFTLIELLVAIGITVLLSGGGLASYNRFNYRQIIRNEGAAITELLRLAQVKALTGEKPGIGACVSATLDGWRVRVVSNNSLVLEAVCGGEGVGTGKTHVLADDTSLVAGREVTFKVLAQGTVGDNFCVSGFSWLYQVQALASGQIADDGFVESCLVEESPVSTPTPTPIPTSTPSPTPTPTSTPTPSPLPSPSPSIIDTCGEFCINLDEGYETGVCVKKKKNCNFGFLKSGGDKYCNVDTPRCCCD